MVSVLDELTEADLARILTEPKNALVKQYRKMFAVDGVDLVFTEQAVNAIASTAIRAGRVREGCGRSSRRPLRRRCSSFQAWMTCSR